MNAAGIQVAVAAASSRATSSTSRAMLRPSEGLIQIALGVSNIHVFSRSTSTYSAAQSAALAATPRTSGRCRFSGKTSHATAGIASAIAQPEPKLVLASSIATGHDHGIRSARPPPAAATRATCQRSQSTHVAASTWPYTEYQPSTSTWNGDVPHNIATRAATAALPVSRTTSRTSSATFSRWVTSTQPM